MTTLMVMNDLVVLGAGPAGLLAAITARERGLQVLVLEKDPRAGRKLLITGGGRCNFTNNSPLDDFIRAFGPKSRFVAPALRAFPPNKLMAFFADLGVQTAAPDGQHCYPADNKAATVLQALLQKARSVGVEILYGVAGEKLEVVDGAIAGVWAAGERIPARAVLLASGGVCYGGSPSGYELARQAGHKIVPPSPALVGLVTEADLSSLAGVSLVEVGVGLAAGKSLCQGGLLFTHRGISGPAVLNISGMVATLLTSKKGEAASSLPVFINLLPQVEDWSTLIDIWRRERGTKRLVKLLGELLPAALTSFLLKAVGLPEELVGAQLSKKGEYDLVGILTALPLAIRDTEGMRKAMVTRGGIEVAEVETRRLGSKLVAGVYFAGEVLDVDGPCGGFNLQWAFSSGHLVGEAIF